MKSNVYFADFSPFSILKKISTFPVSIKSLKPRQHEEVLVYFLVEFAAPIPSRGETTVDARSAVGTGSVEAVPEKVAEDHELGSLGATKGLLEVTVDEGVCRAEGVDGVEDLDDGGEDAGHLGVLVDEDEGVGDVAVAEMDDGEADPAASVPGADLHLDAAEDLGHDLGDAGGGLDAVEALTGVAEAVGRPLVEEVAVGADPQAVHLVLDLAPELQGLQDEGVLGGMRVGQLGALVPVADLQGGLLRALAVGREVGPEELDHAVDGMPVLRDVRVGVRDRVDDALHVLLGQRAWPLQRGAVPVDQPGARLALLGLALLQLLAGHLPGASLDVDGGGDDGLVGEEGEVAGVSVH